MANEKLSKLEAELYATQQKLKAAENDEKYYARQLQQLTRAERTHRLCTRAGILETFLREPTLLTDDDVMELLQFIFHSEAAQKKLELLIEQRRKTSENGNKLKPLTKDKGATIHHLKWCVASVLPKAHCMEQIISVWLCPTPIIQGEATLPLRWLCQLPLCGLAPPMNVLQIIHDNKVAMDRLNIVPL